MDDDQLTPEEQKLIDGSQGGVAEADAAAVQDAPAAEGQLSTAEGGEEGQATQEGDKKPGERTVPHQALHDERERRKATEQQLAEERKQRQVLEERTNLLLQRIAMPQPAAPADQNVPPALPPIESDPVGHILGRMNQQGEILGAVVQALAGQGRQQEQATAENTLRQRAAAMESEFTREMPDYPQAAAHLFETRRRMLAAAGYTDPAEINAIMMNEANSLARRAFDLGKNPAEAVYELSKTLGYQSPAAVPNPAANGGAAGDAEQQVRAIAQGQQQARTVGRMSGTSPAPIDAARLANMSDDEFAAWYAKATPAQQRAAMGA